MADVRACHQEIFVADFCCAAFRAAAMNRAVLADDVVVSDLDFRFPFRRKGNVLGGRANDCAVPNEIAGADRDVAFYHDVRLHDRFLTDHSLRSNYRERSDLDISADLRIRIDNGSGMNFHAGHLVFDFAIRISVPTKLPPP